MGRDPSHLVLECALQTHPNMVLISEEILSQEKGLIEVVKDIADLIVLRSKHGKNFGTILIPEGLLVHLPRLKSLIEELNQFFTKLDRVLKHNHPIPNKLVERNTISRTELRPRSRIRQDQA